tara:strand:- start:155 stop:1132 length:978 start_codon:yes stop_codon:yes gene_type:complete
MFPSYSIFRQKCSFLFNEFKIHFYDICRDIKYSNGFYNDDKEEKLLTVIVVDSHSIEKGLTMPNGRLGFGKAKILTLIKNCDTYKRNYNIKDELFLEALGVIKEYLHNHEVSNYVLDSEIINNSNSLLNSFDHADKTIQPQQTNVEYFQHANSSFELFSASRRSLRSFSGKIPADDLLNAINLANSAPSTCNRQSTRIHVVNDEFKKQQLLKIQSGNRGFGHLADSLIIITSDLASWSGGRLRNGPYVDGGIFTMNLLYSLHYYKIAACSLNLYLSVKKDKKFREIISIPNNETIIVMIAVGNVPEVINIAKSGRKNQKSILSIH